MTRRKMYVKKLAWVAMALATAFCCRQACAETWTWIGGSTNGWANSKVTPGAANREWQEGYNWRDSSGVRGDDWFSAADHGYRPANGDTIIFDTSVANEYTHCWGGVDGVKYGTIIVRGANNWKGCYGTQPNVQDGGSMRLESPISASFPYVWSRGTMTVYVVAGGTMTLCYTKQSSTIRPVVKTGGGIWKLGTGYDSFWTTFDLQGGTVECTANNQFNTSTSFTFNGPDTKLDIRGFNQKVADAALAESSKANGHVITSATPACLTLSGTQGDTTFSGNIAGAVSICWDPMDASKTLTLSASALDTTGTLIVSNGVLKLMGGEVLPSGRLDIEGGKLEVQANGILFMRSGSLVQGDVVVADGLYVSVASPGRTDVSWMAGDGVLIVGDPTGGMSTSATWTGTGPMTTAANWNGAAELPDVYGGTLCMSVEGGTSATVDKDVWIKGIDIASGVTAFSFMPSNAHILWLGAQGLTTPDVSGTYSIQAPFGILGAQTWTVGATDTLTLKAPLATVKRGTVTMGGTGTYEFQAGSPDLANDLAVVSSMVNVRADYALGGAAGTTSFTNATVKFFGTTQARPLVFGNNTSSTFFTIEAGTTNVFNGNVFLARAGGTLNLNSGTEIFAGGLEFPSDGEFTITGGVCIVTNQPVSRGTWARQNVVGGEFHLFAPSNEVNVGQQGWVSGQGTTFYTHVTNAIYKSHMNLSGNKPGGAIWDLCGCDQRVINIQCGRGDNGPTTGADKWKSSTQPGTIRSDLPAVLHLADAEYSTRPINGSSPSSTNWAYFVGQAGISKEGSYKSHWLMQECSSSGMVQVTQGELYIAKRFVDRDGYDYGQGSWTNASKAVAKGTGTLVFQHSACIGKRTNVEISESGKLRLEAGVRQRCYNLYLPDGTGGLVKQPLGSYGSSASGATHKNDTYFSGTGMLMAVGDGSGFMLIVR